MCGCSRPTLVVLAAGLSRRFGRPKALEPLGPCGETLPQYTAYDAIGAGFRRIVFVVHPEAGHALRDHLATRIAPGIEVDFVPQHRDPATPARPKPWGTGAAVLAAARAVEGPFVVANVDDLYGRQALDAAARHLLAKPAPGVSAVVGFTLHRTLSEAGGVSRAVCKVSPDGALLGIEEVLEIGERDGAVVGRAARSGALRTLRGDELVSMNLWVLAPDLVSRLEAAFSRFLAEHARSASSEFLIGDAVQALIAGGCVSVRVLPCSTACRGITHPDDRAPLVAAIARLVDEGRYPSPLPGHR